MKHEITILTATYNSESTLLDSITSIQNQTYSNIKHLVIDGESTDRTIEIIKKKELTHPNFSYVSGKDQGIFDAYNKGIKLVTSEVIGILNSDDFYIDEHVISKVMDIFKNDEVDIVYGDLLYVDQLNTNNIKRVWRSPHEQKLDFSRDSIPAHPSLFARKSVYDRCGYFDKNCNYSGDYDFMLRAFQSQFTFRYLPEPLVKMRVGGRTGGGLKDIYKQNKEVVFSARKNKVHINLFLFTLIKIKNRLQQLYFAFRYKNT